MVQTSSPWMHVVLEVKFGNPCMILQASLIGDVYCVCLHRVGKRVQPWVEEPRVEEGRERSPPLLKRCVLPLPPSPSPSPKEEETACLWNVSVCTQVANRITSLETKVGEREPQIQGSVEPPPCILPLTWVAQSPPGAPPASHPV